MNKLFGLLEKGFTFEVKVVKEKTISKVFCAHKMIIPLPPFFHSTCHLFHKVQL